MGKFIDNKEFYDDIVEFFSREDVKSYLELKRKGKHKNVTPPQIPEKLGRYFVTLANHYATKGTWSYLPFRDEMISDAILRCCIALFSYDPSRNTSPFSYFTSVCTREFIGRIQREKKQERVVLSQIDEFIHNSQLDGAGSSDVVSMIEKYRDHTLVHKVEK